MEEFKHISLNNLIADPDQPRKDFEQEALQELSDSIKAIGVTTPITVRINPNTDQHEEYMIIAGERRWKASKMAGKDTIPAVIKELEVKDNDQLYAEQLSENLHRQNLNPVELAEFIQKRIDHLKANDVTNCVEQAAKEIGVSPSWVSKKLSVLKFSEEVRALARNGKLRDYSLLKKIDSLGNKKKNEAMLQIESGKFNAKEFFSRKRKKANDADLEQENTSDLQKNNTTEQQELAEHKHRFELTRAEVIELIKKTEFKFVLENGDSQWMDADDKTMKQYLKNFQTWLVA